MKILWICNSPIPKISELLGKKASPFAGWLVTVANHILQGNHDLAICFPVFDGVKVEGEHNNLHYYGFCENAHKLYEYSNDNQKEFEVYIEKFKPEVIHIWGTEYPRSLAMMKAAEAVGFDMDRVLVSIQGLATMYCDHYFSGIPNKVIHGYTLRDVARYDNLYQQYLKFVKQAESEKQCLSMAKNVIGRTRWDYGATRILAPKSRYFFCNETLRGSFYQSDWSYENCKKHTIFVSQSSYPIKGFHYVLKALVDILKDYPEAKIVTTGPDPRKLSVSKRTSYQKYLADLIGELNLNDHVQFDGLLSETEMCQHYLDANVFVSASSIENSPNSVGEAMLVGMPIVASYVGGTMDLLKENEEGYLYQSDAPYMLAHYVKEVFADTEKSISMGRKAKLHASQTHNIEKNMNDLLQIYNTVLIER